MKRAILVAAVLAAALLVPSTPAGAVSAGENLCTLGARTSSTPGADLIIGTAGNDSLSGGTGDDTILGCGGNDTIYGDDGYDLLIGGQGNDTVYGNRGDDMFGSGEYRTWDQYFDPPLELLQGNAQKRSINFTVADVPIRTLNVRLDIAHQSPSDLKIKLLSPLVRSDGSPRTVVLTDRNCFGPSSTTNRCGPGQFHSTTSPEVGVTFTSDTSVGIAQSGARNRNLNGIFHPRGTIEGGFRFQPSSCYLGNCTYSLEFTDTVSNKIKGAIHYAAIDIEVPSGTDGQDVYTGGSGVNDLATYVSRNTDITYIGEDDLANDGESGENDNVKNDVEWFYGGLGNDNLTGTNNTHGGFNDTRGYEGNDTVYGLDGNDRLDYHASNGTDTMYGGEGNDRLDGGRTLPAVDYEDGGNGTDRCLNALTAVDCETFV